MLFYNSCAHRVHYGVCTLRLFQCRSVWLFTNRHFLFTGRVFSKIATLPAPGRARNMLRAGVDFYLCSLDSTSLMDIRWTNILRLSETLMYENIEFRHHSRQRHCDAITLDWIALAAPPHVLADELISAFVVAARKGIAVTMSQVTPLSSFLAKCRCVRGAVEHAGFVP